MSSDRSEDQFAHNKKGDDEVDEDSGKWLLFFRKEYGLKVWETVAKAIENNELGPVGKFGINRRNPKGSVIMVYTKDCNDMPDVSRVAKRIRKLVHYPMSMFYKSNQQSNENDPNNKSMYSHPYIPKKNKDQAYGFVDD